MGLRMYKLYKNFDELCEVVVDKLEDNKIIGWFQGKSEFGPRALGNRSILANPIFDNKDYINDNIKHREAWRPYAPIMLEEELHKSPVDVDPKALYQLNNQFIYVNRGFGFLGYQGRVGILPEITILNLESA